ncbi:hypothetical protein DPMN_104515 [Dreissena polymorpha]|uniref:Uncharacterized protein n=1 Tax=Dreissena polymorpha TaxID=45954 RepID=A0A9D4HC64_DREPO|nr:hypothetical protein DPMN_104515 [Dreissena polymorpha]
MATPVVTGRRLHPRRFPQCVAHRVPSLRPPSIFLLPSPAPDDLHTGKLAFPLFPDLFRRDLDLAGPGQRTLDDKQRLTRPLHLAKDSEPIAVEESPARGLADSAGLAEPPAEVPLYIRKYVQVRKSYVKRPVGPVNKL